MLEHKLVPSGGTDRYAAVYLKASKGQYRANCDNAELECTDVVW